MTGRTYVCKYNCDKPILVGVDDYVKVGNRYAHETCHKHHEEKAKQYTLLTDYIQNLYAPHEPDWKLITSQIKRYEKEGMTYYGMRYTLEYFFTIKGGKIDPNFGVGIIPYQYKKAQSYYSQIQNTIQKTEQVLAEEKKEAPREEIIIIESSRDSRKKLIDFSY
jgi:hypothetical protein